MLLKLLPQGLNYLFLHLREEWIKMEEHLKLLQQQHMKALQSYAQTPAGQTRALSVPLSQLLQEKRLQGGLLWWFSFFPMKEGAAYLRQLPVDNVKSSSVSRALWIPWCGQPVPLIYTTVESVATVKAPQVALNLSSSSDSTSDRLKFSFSNTKCCNASSRPKSESPCFPQGLLSLHLPGHLL